jgi:hypothetical protein
MKTIKGIKGINVDQSIKNRARFFGLHITENPPEFDGAIIARPTDYIKNPFYPYVDAEALILMLKAELQYGKVAVISGNAVNLEALLTVTLRFNSNLKIFSSLKLEEALEFLGGDSNYKEKIKWNQ